jgi:hypothetical protein
VEVTLLDGSTLPLDLPKAATGNQQISSFFIAGSFYFSLESKRTRFTFAWKHVQR